MAQCIAAEIPACLLVEATGSGLAAAGTDMKPGQSIDAGLHNDITVAT